MDKWDGQPFIGSVELHKSKSVLEIGVETGCLGLRAAPLFRFFVGIDISPKTVIRAKNNFSQFNNAALILDDYLTYDFRQKFFFDFYAH